MSEKLNQQLEQQDLEAMADQLLAEDAAKREEEDSKSRKKLDDKTIAALPAATLITANEKLKDLLAKAARPGSWIPASCRTWWIPWIWTATRWTASTIRWRIWASRWAAMSS